VLCWFSSCFGVSPTALPGCGSLFLFGLPWWRGEKRRGPPLVQFWRWHCSVRCRDMVLPGRRAAAPPCPSSTPASSRPWLVRGFRWQAFLLRRRWWSCSLCIFCLALLGLEAPLFEHSLDGRSKPFCIQGPLRTYSQAGHKLWQRNLLGEALSEIGYRIQRRIEGKWFRPRIHP
jgi:hypothetical protein